MQGKPSAGSRGWDEKSVFAVRRWAARLGKGGKISLLGKPQRLEASITKDSSIGRQATIPLCLALTQVPDAMPAGRVGIEKCCRGMDLECGENAGPCLRLF